MSAESDLLRQYQGRLVPETYDAGFVALSFVVSLIGAGSTLELINRRTGFNGVFNHFLLAGSAVTMGGVSIWCMHFVGNRAITLADGQAQLQIAYSGGFTAMSFFVPIVVLAAAFVAVGSNNVVSWWRVSMGGILCGAAVCGMHYLGNASIENYRCVYQIANVAGAATISVAASTIALSMFFVFRAMWANAWWKRVISAVILAGAVSGMHWVAAIGTQYRLVKAGRNRSTLSRNATVIIVICLSVGASLVIAASAIVKARHMSRSAARAQKVTLGAAIFDKQGRILVDTNGLVPNTVITDSFLEKNTKEGFSIAHPTFHWMFRASRCWMGISKLVPGMRCHLRGLPHTTRGNDGKLGIELINEYGELIDDYDVIFREMFCVAASTLADQLREHLTSMGVLWDDILATGESGRRTEAEPENQRRPSTSISDALEKAQARTEYGRGSLMFLVRRVSTDREIDGLVSAGYRFADLHQVADIIKARMQIKSNNVESQFRAMAGSADHGQLKPGLHLGFFGVRARVNSTGFDILVPKNKRNALPTVSLDLEDIEPWQRGFLGRFAGMSPWNMTKCLEAMAMGNRQESILAGRLRAAVTDLRNSVQEPFFDEAVLTPGTVQVPAGHGDTNGTAEVLAFRLMIPIHAALQGSSCEMIPLSFFKVQQTASGNQLQFAQGVHREFGLVLKGAPAKVPSRRKSQHFSKFWGRQRADEMTVPEPLPSQRYGVNAEAKMMTVISDTRLSSSGSIRSGSTANLCQQEDGSDVSTRGDETPKAPMTYTFNEVEQMQPPRTFGGILVSQEITVDIEAAGGTGDWSSSRGGNAQSESQMQPVDDGRIPRRNSSSQAAIEMKPLGHFGINVQSGSRAQSVSGRDVSAQHATAFVDILFAQSVENQRD